MNIISWNVRGMGRPAKCFLVKDFLNLHFTDVCCLQESKLENISVVTWREIGGPRLDKFAFTPSVGASGASSLDGIAFFLRGRWCFRENFTCRLISFPSRTTLLGVVPRYMGQMLGSLRVPFGRKLGVVVFPQLSLGCYAGILMQFFLWRIRQKGNQI